MFSDMPHKTQENTTKTIRSLETKSDDLDSTQILWMDSANGEMTTTLEDDISLYEEEDILQNTIDE